MWSQIWSSLLEEDRPKCVSVAAMYCELRKGKMVFVPEMSETGKQKVENETELVV